jgi:hypothetical protein
MSVWLTKRLLPSRTPFTEQIAACNRLDSAVKALPGSRPSERQSGVGADQLVQVVLLVEVGDADAGGAGALAGVAEDQAALELAADAFEGGAGQFQGDLFASKRALET